MHARHLLVRMAENNMWSNARLHRAVARLTREEYEATRTSFFPSIKKTLEHVYLVDLFYVDALERGGKGRAMYDAPDPTFEQSEQLAQAQRAVDARLIAVASSFATDDALDDRVVLSRPRGDFHERAGDVLAHLLQHQVHHRGQAHAMLAGTNVEPPQLDEFFLEEDAPVRDAELAELGLRAP